MTAFSTAAGASTRPHHTNHLTPHPHPNPQMPETLVFSRPSQDMCPSLTPTNDGERFEPGTVERLGPHLEMMLYTSVTPHPVPLVRIGRPAHTLGVPLGPEHGRKQFARSQMQSASVSQRGTSDVHATGQDFRAGESASDALSWTVPGWDPAESWRRWVGGMVFRVQT